MTTQVGKSFVFGLKSVGGLDYMVDYDRNVFQTSLLTAADHRFFNFFSP